MDNKKVIKNISWSFAEKLLTDGMNAIVSIVLARLLLPDDYGLVSLVQVFITISSIFVTCGLGTSLIRNKNATKVQESTLFYLNILLGIMIYIILFLVAPYIANLKNNNDLILVVRVLAIKVPISSIYSMLHSYVQKRMEFKRFFFSSLAGTLMAGVVGIYMAYAGYGVWAIIISTLVDQTMDCIILLLSTRWLPKFRISISESKEMIMFGAKILGSELMSRSYNQARPLIVGLRYTTGDLACNVKGKKFPEMVNDFTNAIILKVMFPVFSDIQDDKEELLDALRKSIRVSSFALLPLLMGMFVTADKFVPLILTENWNGCIPYIQIYCLAYMTLPARSLNIRVIQACGHSNVILKLQTIGIVSDVLFLIVAIFLFDSPIYVCISSLLRSIAILLASILEINKIVNYNMKRIFDDISKTLVATIAMGAIVYFVGTLWNNIFIVLVLQIIVGGLTYIVISFFMKNETINQFLYFIKKILKIGR